MNFKDFFQSKKITLIIYLIGVVIIGLLIFKAGVLVGYRKASFSYNWGENYHRNFEGPKNGFPKILDKDDFGNSNGAFGKIIKIDLPKIIIQSSNDDMEKVVLVNSDTFIKRFQKTINPQDLKIDNQVFIIGESDGNGQIIAKFIRVLPTSAFNINSSSTLDNTSTSMQ